MFNLDQKLINIKLLGGSLAKNTLKSLKIENKQKDEKNENIEIQRKKFANLNVTDDLINSLSLTNQKIEAEMKYKNEIINKFTKYKQNINPSKSFEEHFRKKFKDDIQTEENQVNDQENSPNKDFYNRVSSPHMLCNTKYSNDNYRLNYTKHYQYSQQAADFHSRKHEPKETEKTISIDYSSLVKSKKNNRMNFLKNTILNKVTKIEDDVERISNSFCYDEQKQKQTTHQQLQNNIVKNQKQFSDIRKYQDKKVKEIPDQSLVSKSMENCHLVHNFINKKKRRFDVHSYLNYDDDQGKFDSLYYYLKSIMSNKDHIQFKYITQMHFYSNNFIKFKDCHLLISDRIKYLTINHCKIDSDCFIRIFNVIKKGFNSLKCMNISNNNLNGKQISEILYNCSGFDNLNTIDISYNDFTFVDKQRLEKSFGAKGNCNIKKILLISCRLDIFTLSDFLASISNNSSIKELDVSDNNFDLQKILIQSERNRVKEQISSFMMSNKSVAHLQMSNCNINRDSAQFFLTMLSMRPSVLLIHSNGNNQPFDSISMINKQQQDSLFKSYQLKMTCCAFCDQHVVRELRISADEYEYFTSIKNQILQVCVEQQEFNPILMTKADGAFVVKLTLPKLDMTFQIKTSHSVILDIQGLFFQKKIGEHERKFIPNPMVKRIQQMPTLINTDLAQLEEIVEEEELSDDNSKEEENDKQDLSNIPNVKIANESEEKKVTSKKKGKGAKKGKTAKKDKTKVEDISKHEITNNINKIDRKESTQIDRRDSLRERRDSVILDEIGTKRRKSNVNLDPFEAKFKIKKLMEEKALAEINANEKIDQTKDNKAKISNQTSEHVNENINMKEMVKNELNSSINVPKFDVNLIRSAIKIKKPAIELEFMNSAEDIITFSDNEYLKLQNQKRIFKECQQFDLLNSNIYKWLSDAMKVDEKLIQCILNNLLSLNQEKFVDFQVQLMAVNNQKKDEFNFQIREKVLFNIVEAFKLQDDEMNSDWLEIAFYATNNDISSSLVKTATNVNEGNEDNKLVRKELQELLLRISLCKYWQSRDPQMIHRAMERCLNEIQAWIPIHALDFKNQYSNSNDLSKAFSCNKVLQNIVFRLCGDRKRTLKLDKIAAQFKAIGVSIPNSEFVQHWCSTLSFESQDFSKNRQFKCDFREFVEIHMRMFLQNREELVKLIDQDIFEQLYKVEKRQVVCKLNRMKNLDMDIAVLLFSHLVCRYIQLDNKSQIQEIQDHFRKCKTLIYYSNMFCDDDQSDDEAVNYQWIKKKDQKDEVNINNYVRKEINVKTKSIAKRQVDLYKDTFLEVKRTEYNLKDLQKDMKDKYD